MIYTKNDNYELHLGKMQDVLSTLPSESIDAVITDPPYELNFMNKGWDNSGVAFQKETWEHCLRVLKPGGYLLAFGGTRTFHRIACAIEDAGFEIRDCIMWLYGSGFPKSMDISKQIDKHNATPFNYRAELARHIKAKLKENNLSVNELKKYFNNSTKVNHWLAEDSNNFYQPTKEEYNLLKNLLGCEEKYYIDEAEREVIGKKEKQISNWNMGGETKYVDRDITLPSTDSAKEWSGWGTCLKPAYEPIIVARKPFQGSLVDNVLEYGVGGLNIDECRINLKESEVKHGGFGAAKTGFQKGIGNSGDDDYKCEWVENTEGRFPANVIHDGSDEVISGMPNTKTGDINPHINKANAIVNKMTSSEITSSFNGDEGNASRYFYCAKASKRDRDEGLDAFEEKKVYGGDLNWGYGNNNGDNFGERVANVTRRNTHPTVKPVALMQYLIKLVCPKGSIILDPFNGSGSTGKAAMYENIDRNAHYYYIGVEMTEEYLPISKARIDYALGDTAPLFDETTEQPISKVATKVSLW